MATPADSQLHFQTDDQLADRLRRVHDRLIHLGYEIPALAREVDALRAELQPGSGGDPGEIADPA